MTRLSVQVDEKFCFIPRFLFYLFFTIVNWGCKSGPSDPPVLFLHKNRFLTTELKRGKAKVEIFSKRLCGWSKKKRRKILRFTGCRIEARHPFTKKRDTVTSMCSVPKITVRTV